MLMKIDDNARRIALREFSDSARIAREPGFGRPVVLAFWSTTCVSCRKELPRLQAWATQRPDVVFLPVLVEGVESAQGAAWLDQIGVTTHGLHDRYQVVGKQYGVCREGTCHVPSLVAILPNQKIALAHQGYVDSMALEAKLDKALGLKGK